MDEDKNEFLWGTSMASQFPHHVVGQGKSWTCQETSSTHPNAHFYLLASFLSMQVFFIQQKNMTTANLTTFPANGLDTGDRNCKLPGTHKEIFQGLCLLGTSTTQALHLRF